MNYSKIFKAILALICSLLVEHNFNVVGSVSALMSGETAINHRANPSPAGNEAKTKKIEVEGLSIELRR